MKCTEYWFRIDSPHDIDYVCAIQPTPYKTLGGIIDSESDLNRIKESVESIGRNLPRKSKNVDIFPNWNGQEWAMSARKKTKGVNAR